MLKSGGRINDLKEAAKVRSMLAVEMDGNNRRKFLDVARAVLMTRAGGERYRQILNGSFSAVSKPNLQASTRWKALHEI